MLANANMDFVYLLLVLVVGRSFRNDVNVVKSATPSRRAKNRLKTYIHSNILHILQYTHMDIHFLDVHNMLFILHTYIHTYTGVQYTLSCIHTCI